MQYFDTPLTGLRKRETVSNLPKGLTGVRAAIAHAIAQKNHLDPRQVAADRWGINSPVVEKAALPALNVGIGSGAQMNDTSVGDPELFGLVYNASVIGRLGIRPIPFHVRMLNMDEGPVTGWRAQGGAFKTATPKATNVAGFERFSVGAVVVMTDELLNSNTVAAEVIVRDQIVRALAQQIDSDFISPSNSGTASTKPASVSNAGSAMDSPSEAFLDWSSTFTGDPNASVLLVNSWDAARLYGAARPDIGVRGGSLAGFPVVTSTAVPEGFVILLDPNQVSLAMDGAEIRVARQASIEMNTAPSGSSVTPASSDQTLVSMFQSNSAAIQGFVYANWALMKPNACKVYDLQSYGLAGGN
jgi:hypothetical protein